jgi:YebC/PmpR family DNA-binding regulatory protein
MAGHSHWSKIKRAKGANDAMRGKIWSKIVRKIMIAAKGGGDPNDNLNLRYTIDEAKAANVPRDTIEKAIKKGSGELGAENFEDVVYEAYAGGGVAMMIEGLTNNPSRTAPDIRAILERGGGNLATRGAVAFQFTKQGIITIKTDAVSEDALLELALEAGAEDVKNQGEVYEVLTSPTAYLKVKEAIDTANLPVEGGEITYLPNNTVPTDAETAQKILKLIDALDDNDDVQNVSHNAEMPDSVTAA